MIFLKCQSCDLGGTFPHERPSIAYKDQLNKGPLPQIRCHPLDRQIHLVLGMEERKFKH